MKIKVEKGNFGFANINNIIPCEENDLAFGIHIESDNHTNPVRHNLQKRYLAVKYEMIFLMLSQNEKRSKAHRTHYQPR